jgi:hypothetical protein
MNADPSPLAGKSPEVREIAATMGNQYLEAGAKFYPELRPLDPGLKTTATIAPVAAGPAAPLEVPVRAPSITMPAMPMLAPPLPEPVSGSEPSGPSAQAPAATAPEQVAEAAPPPPQQRPRPPVGMQAGMG